MGDLIAIVAIVCIFGLPLSIPLLKVWAKHQSDMMQMRLRLQQGEGHSHADIAALRQEIQALRETSMQYDLSFDAALQRLEQRVGRSEQNAQNAQFHSAYDANETNGITASLHNGN